MVKILVSVVDSEEARRLVDLDVDIVDVKNPSAGSLAAPELSKLVEVVKVVGGIREVSVALGDVKAWSPLLAYAAYAAASLGVSYVKVGVEAGIVEEAVRIARSVVEGVKGSGTGAKVVIVGYADYSKIGSAEPLKIVDVAKDVGADGVMIDTRIKDGSRSLDLLGFEYLRKFAEKAHSSGLFAALAGSLGISDVCTAAALGFDVVGFRGAVCESGRTSRISRRRVEELIQISRSCRT